jgi:lipid II:glycine glycyltransferase (peptidoglycan interpeptide bridge formation enzyme)
MLASNSKNLGRTIFHEEWWLDVVTDGQYRVVGIKNGAQTVGWLPYSVRRRWGFDISDMPLLTHTLGPVIHPGTGRPSTQLLNTFAITTALLEKLPKLAHFRQVLSPTVSEALGYQAYGCHVKVQFTFVADCTDIEEKWKNMRDKTRNLIRRSREKNTVSTDHDPDEFLRFYDSNCKERGVANRYQDPKTIRILNRCLERDQGKVLLSKSLKTGAANAGIVVVWDASCMYFLMSTRSVKFADSGAVSLLIWEAMNEAHRRGLKFDFDGVSNAGTFRFLSGFGCDIARRLVVEKFDLLYHSMDKFRALIYGNSHRSFD